MADELFKEVQQEFLLTAASPTGAVCPCCQQNLRVYRRRMNRRAVQYLIGLRDANIKAGQPFHMPDKLGLGGEWARLKQWGFIREAHPGKHDGIWSITDSGALWLSGDTSVPSVAVMWRGQCIGFAGHMVSVEDFE